MLDNGVREQRLYLGPRREADQDVGHSPVASIAGPAATSTSGDDHGRRHARGGGTTIWFLYQAAFDEERARLVEIAQSQARSIEAVARFNVRNSQATDLLPNRWTVSRVN